MSTLANEQCEGQGESMVMRLCLKRNNAMSVPDHFNEGGFVVCRGEEYKVHWENVASGNLNVWLLLSSLAWTEQIIQSLGNLIEFAVVQWLKITIVVVLA